MAKTKETKIAQAALVCASERAWADVTLEQIAKTAKIQLRHIEDLFPDTLAVLSAIIRYIDAEAIHTTGKPNRKDTLHDRLFAIIMARFDVLQEHRKAILSITKTIEPLVLLTLLEELWTSAKKTLHHARSRQKKEQNTLHQATLLLIIAATFSYWKNDTSKDMARTMAALDRFLSYGKKFGLNA